MFTAKQLVNIFASPGFKGSIEEAAPNQSSFVGTTVQEGREEPTVERTSVQDTTGFSPKSKGRRLDRWLDLLVRASGSEPVFLFILSGLLAWAFLGIRFGDSTEWAVVISDVQAIVSYMFDSLLMRQQLNGYDQSLRVSASLRSRSLSNRRMLREILRGAQYKTMDRTQFQNIQLEDYSADLPAENLVGRISTFASKAMGHLVTVGLFWVGIFIWIGFGPYMGWSDSWQLYINSSTSAFMVLIFAFLANIRERHNAYTEKCLNLVFEVDSKIERQLRIMTGDATPNPTVVIPAPKVSMVQRAIFYYADVVGTLVGIAILILVLVVWLCIGPLMSFNSNWWLLIGTYAGLIGLNDGFVLRNVQDRLNDYENAAFDEVNLEDMNVFADAGIPDPGTRHVQDRSINYRLSVKMGVLCAHEITVILGVLLIFGLITGSSVMKWTETGQLLCNVPPSIIESFFMMILITGHNVSDSRRRMDLHNVYLRRLRLLVFVERLASTEKK